MKPLERPSSEIADRLPEVSDALACFFRQVRSQTERLCEPLSVEDHLLQSMPQASPAKWHLAHTSWFFETFVLAEHLPGYRLFHPRWGFLFNSYYNSVGARVARQQRGLLSRPSVADVYRYRSHVDAALLQLLASEYRSPVVEQLVMLGLQHEQQHQELLLTDIKHGLSVNPLRPIYREQESVCPPAIAPLRWLDQPGGLVSIGHAGDGFAFDNESPQHTVFLRPYRIASRLVSCGEYREFMEAGGYEQPQWWLSDGWDTCRQHNWVAPLYWERHEGQWWHFTLTGFRPVVDNEPVTHVSFYEADAYARWAGARLCTEAEWEAACQSIPLGSFLEGDHLHPHFGCNGGLTGEAWQWTASPYIGYPGYRPPEGALGEYNGKFMCNQFVLRGGSCATPRSHYRPSYRNFFPPEARWQFTGIRLGIDA
jgi:ergothioneine biosynthesis protein EgtB